MLEVDSRQHRSFDKGFGGEQAGECAGEPGAEVGPGGKGGREDGVEGEDAGNEGRGVVAGVVGDGGDAVGLASGETWASTVAMWQPMTRASRVSLSARTRGTDARGAGEAVGDGRLHRLPRGR